MNELNVAPAATETADPVAPAVTEPNTTEGVAQTSEPTEKAEKTAEQKELEYLRRKATKADRNNARLYQELQEARRARETPQAEPQEKVEVDPQRFKEVVRTEAQELRRVERLNEQCNAVATDGKKNFPDFDEALDSLRSELPLFNETGPTAAMKAILAAKTSAAALIHHLGKNPDVASELADLEPEELAFRLADIRRELSKPVRQVSNAPKPLEPVKPAASTSGEPDIKDTKRWIAWKNKQSS